jgi:hypothetical protein
MKELRKLMVKNEETAADREARRGAFEDKVIKTMADSNAVYRSTQDRFLSILEASLRQNAN